jgi:hypothetical protein
MSGGSGLKASPGKKLTRLHFTNKPGMVATFVIPAMWEAKEDD